MLDIRFHHFGLAVNYFERAIKFHKNLGYKIEKPIRDEIHNVELVMCTSKQFPSVELIKPINEQSPINKYLDKNNEIIYHVCYEVNCLKNDTDLIISGSRAICVSEPKPAILFNNRKVAFYYLIGVGLIEILERSQNS